MNLLLSQVLKLELFRVIYYILCFERKTRKGKNFVIKKFFAFLKSQSSNANVLLKH